MSTKVITHFNFDSYDKFNSPLTHAFNFYTKNLTQLKNSPSLVVIRAVLKADPAFFHLILSFSYYAKFGYLPPKRPLEYGLRPQSLK